MPSSRRKQCARHYYPQGDVMSRVEGEVACQCNCFSARGATLLSVVQGKPRQGRCITLLPYYERITDLPPLFFPRPDLKWRHNVFTTTATCLPKRIFGLTCFRIRYPINFHKHRYSIRIMFNMWRFHDVALTATMIKMYQFNEKM